MLLLEQSGLIIRWLPQAAVFGGCERAADGGFLTIVSLLLRLGGDAYGIRCLDDFKQS